MAYATQADLDLEWGASLVDILTIDATTLHRDAGKIASNLEKAAAVVNSYVARRYPMPLTPTPDGAILLRGCTADICIYQLATTADRLTEIIEKRYEKAIALLKDIAAGKADIAVSGVAPGAAISQNEAVIEAPPRIFSRDSLKGM